MKRRFTILFFLWVCIGYAQITSSPLSSRYTGVGVYSKNFTDAFSGTNNQALLAEANNVVAGMYGERRFMLKELSNYAFAIVLPSGSGGFGFAINYFGGPNFSTSQAGIGYGRKLSAKIDIGVQFNYNNIRLAGYGSNSNVNFEIGTLWHITDQFNFGIHVYNPVGGRFGKDSNEKLPSIYRTGIGYEASAKFFISAEIAKEEDQPANVNMALQYNFAEQFLARGGLSAANGNYFFGLGLKWKVCRMDIVTTYHPLLGFTPGLMLLFDFKNKKRTAEE
jgi:long-subunit fatty acid transport protein